MIRKCLCPCEAGLVACLLTKERGRTRGKKWEELKEILCDSDAYRKSFVTLIAARNSSQGGTKNNKRDSLSARKMWGAKTCVQFGGNEANIKKNGRSNDMELQFVSSQT